MKIVHGLAYGLAMLFPSGTPRAQRRRAMAFAEKCTEALREGTPFLFSVLINLALVAVLATVVIRPAFEPRTDGTITMTHSKFLEDTPVVEMPAGGGNSDSFSPELMELVLATGGEFEIKSKLDRE